jgi:CHAT domain-containing protein
VAHAPSPRRKVAVDGVPLALTAPTTPGAGQAVRGLLGPYFALLVDRGAAGAGDFFDASQILVRPGVAQTQAVLARELSGGSDAASSLFRQSVTLSRDIVRTDAEIARLTASADGNAEDGIALARLRSHRDALGADQTAVLARLSDYPRYRSITNDTVRLTDLQGRLRAGEAYFKLVLVGDLPYGLFTTATTAQIFKVGASTADLGTMVTALRDSIVKFENGRPATYPFDAVTARRMYLALFGPVDAAMPAVKHLIFEPDGPLLQLPANLLIASEEGLPAYLKRAEAADGDPFDMRGIQWLGRTRMVSTAVSPRAFMEVRALAPSRGAHAYLGLGENAIPGGVAPAVIPASVQRTRGAMPEAAPQTPLPARDPCDWPLREWGNPIQPAELRIGATLLGGNGGAEVITGAPFNDTALKARTDLRSYRVIHFATHGLVTAPRPECPARPALLTSFGDTQSDGLLSFREIFDLSLDADTIILSACDTAGTATAAATREAGVATGGNYALDGLVRAFVGAGARAVINASPEPFSNVVASVAEDGLTAAGLWLVFAHPQWAAALAGVLLVAVAGLLWLAARAIGSLRRRWRR